MSQPAAISPGITYLPIQKISSATGQKTRDPVAIEEPLEIRLRYGPAGHRREQSLSVTMRTPGNDLELALGFLYTEGIIPATDPAAGIIPAEALSATPETTPNSILIPLDGSIPVDLSKLQRHFYTSSSCGVCGKTSIEALHTVCPVIITAEDDPVDAALLYSLPSLLRQKQDIFDATGGLHAAAIFDHQGRLTILREDIGRHNALDKAIGYALQQGLLPLSSSILLLSGRACFELIQKAAMAGIRIVVAIGPPSSLAVELATTTGITLVGFLREQRCNIYSGADRVRIQNS